MLRLSLPCQTTAGLSFTMTTEGIEMESARSCLERCTKYSAQVYFLFGFFFGFLFGFYWSRQIVESPFISSPIVCDKAAKSRRQVSKTPHIQKNL